MATQLSPLEEALFQAWSRAHRIDDQNDPKNSFDYRGVYKRTNGLIHPSGHINQMAQEHNAAAQAEGSGGAIDPAMAAVEHQKNQMDAQKAQADQALKIHLADKGHAQKIQLEQMKMNHKSQEADKDRQIDSQQAQIDRQHEVQQTQVDHQHQAQQSQVDRQHSLQDVLMKRQHTLQDQKTDQHNELKGQMLTEHLTRTRPAPKTSTHTAVA